MSLNLPLLCVPPVAFVIKIVNRVRQLPFTVPQVSAKKALFWFVCQNVPAIKIAETVQVESSHAKVGSVRNQSSVLRAVQQARIAETVQMESSHAKVGSVRNQSNVLQVVQQTWIAETVRMGGTHAKVGSVRNQSSVLRVVQQTWIAESVQRESSHVEVESARNRGSVLRVVCLIVTVGFVLVLLLLADRESVWPDAHLGVVVIEIVSLVRGSVFKECARRGQHSVLLLVLPMMIAKHVQTIGFVVPKL